MIPKNRTTKCRGGRSQALTAIDLPGTGLTRVQGSVQSNANRRGTGDYAAGMTIENSVLPGRKTSKKSLRMRPDFVTQEPPSTVSLALPATPPRIPPSAAARPPPLQVLVLAVPGATARPRSSEIGMGKYEGDTPIRPRTLSEETFNITGHLPYRPGEAAGRSQADRRDALAGGRDAVSET